MSGFSLDYLTSGKRDYGEKPIPAYRRGAWEFQAIISGECLYEVEGEESQLSKGCMWLSSPDSRHGWSNHTGQECAVVVFQFNEVPNELSGLLAGRERVSLSLHRSQIRRVKELYNELLKYYATPCATSDLHVQKGVLELSLMFLDQESHPQVTSRQYYDRLVNQASNLFIANLQNGWTVERIAQELKLSSGHLRRIFKEVCNQSPHEVFNEKRLEFAADLLMSSRHSVTDIALYSGFSSVSVFSRYFRKHYGYTPLGFRQCNMYEREK